MARRRTARNVAISPWLSARLDCREGRYIQVGNSLLLSKQYQALNASARFLYLCMALESGGRPSVRFSHGAARKYGIASSTFERSAKELTDAGFIRLELDEERAQYAANTFRFTDCWKA